MAVLPPSRSSRTLIKRLHAADRNSGWPIVGIFDWSVIGRHPKGHIVRAVYECDYGKGLASPQFLRERDAEIEAVSNSIGLLRLSYDEAILGDKHDNGLPRVMGPPIAVTAIVIATYHGHYDTADWLLRHWASVKLREYYTGSPLGATLLHLLGNLKETRETPQFVEMLVRQGHVSVDALDRDGRTPLAIAAAMGGGDSLLETLVALGANVNYVIPASNGFFAKSVLQYCIWGHLDIEWDRPTWCIPIAPRLRGARRLIELGADVGIKGRQLTMLSQRRYLTSRFYQENPDQVKALREFMAYHEARFPGLIG